MDASSGRLRHDVIALPAALVRTPPAELRTLLAWALGIEVISPEFVTEEEIHSASERLGLEPPPAGNLAPLRAAYIGHTFTFS